MAFKRRHTPALGWAATVTRVACFPTARMVKTVPPPMRACSLPNQCCHATRPNHARPLLPILLLPAASRNSDYILTYALLLAGADPKRTNSFGSSALHNVNCAYRGAPDHFGALTGALLVAFGADPKLKNKQGKVAAAYYLPGNSGNCPAPASTPTTFSCEPL